MSSDIWNIFLIKPDGKKVVISVPNPMTMTVGEFMNNVQKVTNVEPKHQRLLIGSTNLTDKDKEKLLSACGVGNDSTIYLILRLNGGSGRRIHLSILRSKGPCLLMGETYDEPECVVTPCGHVIHPDTLMQFCSEEVYVRHKWEITCFMCTEKLSMDFLVKCGATQGELNSLFKQMPANYCKFNDDADIRKCPGCQCICERIDRTQNIVRCAFCTHKNGKSYDFCWLCSQPWTSGHQCRKNAVLEELLKNCAEKSINGVICPSIRACPNCGAFIHHTEACKHMKCIACQQEFCFVCLLKTTSWKFGHHDSPCNPAERQKGVVSKR